MFPRCKRLPKIGHGEGPGGSGGDLSEDESFKSFRMRKTRSGRRRRKGKKTSKKLVPSANMATMNSIGMRKESNKVIPNSLNLLSGDEN